MASATILFPAHTGVILRYLYERSRRGQLFPAHAGGDLRRRGISNKVASGTGLKRATEKSLPERRALRESIQKEFSYANKWGDCESPIKDKFEKLTTDAQR